MYFWVALEFDTKETEGFLIVFQVSFQATMASNSNLDEFLLRKHCLEWTGNGNPNSNLIFQPINKEDSVMVSFF